ncbi:MULTISPECIES: TetR/AcrR family transcriptional regulator [unclassified Streptomyces]|uniref:TetR/AcrR family transcriptional regulator n=1 Tax=unclassified Streptomyces TaxID=2593676 RepID=UPI001927E096|nr:MULTISPECIES: TetR/AcrR family transcriptional regulator [unclassified Streptomyces]
MSEYRRLMLRMNVSRAACRLFWERGVEATSGKRIANDVGISVRTVWRHFRTKESCAEPVVTYGVEWFMSVVRNWPAEAALADHLAAEIEHYARRSRPEERADEMLALRMISLAETEPALRTVWLTACDRIEGELRTIIAARLERPAADLEIRLHAAAAAGVVRILEEHVGGAVLAGTAQREFGDPRALADRFAGAIRRATGGAVGDPVRGGADPTM